MCGRACARASECVCVRVRACVCVCVCVASTYTRVCVCVEIYLSFCLSVCSRVYVSVFLDRKTNSSRGRKQKQINKSTFVLDDA